MRTILFLSGLPGAGKSTWVKENKLEEYTISSDSIRLLLSNPILDTNGKFGINQNTKVWNVVNSLLEERMKNGDFIVLDATNPPKDIKKYQEMIIKYGYKAFVKTFNNDLEIIKKQNNLRDELRQVSDDVINKMADKFNERYPKFVAEIHSLDEITDCLHVDLSNYNKLKFIGDIHGCFNALQQVFKNGVDDDTAYVFLGDYIDRGIQNKEVLEFLFSIMEKDNVIFLEGNHEDSLQYLINRVEAPKKEFQEKTRKQLEGISLAKTKAFYKKLLECLKITFKDMEFFVSHGGIPMYPKQPLFIPTKQLLKGVGGYSFDIDKAWENSLENYIQVHGHRGNFDTTKNTKSFSLENKVEFDGSLDVLTVENGQITRDSYSNTFSKATTGTKEEVSVIDSLLNNDDIRVKKLSDGSILSVGFKPSVFYDKKWDNINIKARGLFLDSQSKKVIARGYDKFFNVNEVKETKEEHLKDKLKFPVEISVKENGFLGILSHRNGALAFYTKSNNIGEYVAYFEKVFFDKIKDKADELLDLIIKEDISLTFEVIDIVNDPHIIEYDHNKLVFLNTFKNDINNNKDFAIDDVMQILKQTDIDIVEKYEVKSYSQFETLCKSNALINKNIEGFVICDSNDFMLKVKFDYYTNCKRLRTCLNLLQQDKILSSEDPKTDKFIKWFSVNKEKLNGLSFIQINKMFEKSLNR